MESGLSAYGGLGSPAAGSEGLREYPGYRSRKWALLSLSEKKLFSESQVKGIDISPTSVRAAEKLPDPGLSFEVKDVGQTGLASEGFDLITVFQTHFHWPDLPRAFSELRRILRQDGLILLACEWSKLVCFQSEFKEGVKFAALLTAAGLKLVGSQRSGQWVLYKIVKN